MTEQIPVLEFAGLTLHASSSGRDGLNNIGLRMFPGELVLVKLEPGNVRLPLADAAEGLVMPDEGTVAFQGEDWRKMTADKQSTLRGRIGRVFLRNGWISNLNVLENVTLCQRHHTRRKLSEIVAEAEELSKSFGLSEIPKMRPAMALTGDLKRAEWVRAFLGEPFLVILEHALAGVASGYLSGLLDAVQRARSRGAAILWLTTEERIWNELKLEGVLRYVMRGVDMIAAKPARDG